MREYGKGVDEVKGRGAVSRMGRQAIGAEHGEVQIGITPGDAGSTDIRTVQVDVFILTQVPKDSSAATAKVQY